MRARAGKLEWGELGSNECPVGSYRITDEAQCIRAAATAGKPWCCNESYPDRPRGCFWHIGYGSVGLNTDPIGGSDPTRQPLCAVNATGVRACACVWIYIYSSIHLSICRSIFLSFYLSIFIFLYLSTFLSSFYRSSFLSFYLSIHVMRAP